MASTRHRSRNAGHPANIPASARGVRTRLGTLQLAHACGVTAACELGFEKRLHDRHRVSLAHKPSGDAQHVRVVVLPSQARDFGGPAIRRADTRRFIRRNGHTGAGAADQYAKPRPPVRYRRRRRMREIRVIHARRAVTALMQNCLIAMGILSRHDLAQRLGALANFAFIGVNYESI